MVDRAATPAVMIKVLRIGVLSLVDRLKTRTAGGIANQRATINRDNTALAAT
jgi:hypothetical protein